MPLLEQISGTYLGLKLMRNKSYFWKKNVITIEKIIELKRER